MVHGSEFDIGLRDEVVHADGRHVQDTVLAGAVAIEEVITQTQLHLTMHEVTHLGIAAPVIITVVDLLTLREADVHIIGLSPYIPAVLQHGKLKAGTEIIRRFTLCLVVVVRTQAEQQFVLVQQFGVTLRQGHRTLRLIGDTTCIQE